jgi:hypothetical protein
MCEGLYMDGTTNITCIDLSHVAVHNMQNRLLSQKFKGSLSLSCLLFYNLFKRIKVNKLLIIEIHSIFSTLILYFTPKQRMEWKPCDKAQVVNELPLGRIVRENPSSMQTIFGQILGFFFLGTGGLTHKTKMGVEGFIIA